jgi:hypothetical protein
VVQNLENIEDISTVQIPADMKLKRFTHEHLGVLSDSLDDLLLAPSDAGSRLSKSKIGNLNRANSALLR